MWIELHGLAIANEIMVVHAVEVALIVNLFKKPFCLSIQKD
jgi:hypothetical protein